MATRKEVAAYAGVSVATVSNVMNHTKPVSDEVREKVEKAIRELDYHPNLVARSLATKRTKHVAFLVDNLKNPYYSQVLEGAQACATEHGYIISTMMFDYSEAEDLIRMLSRGVEGVISATLQMVEVEKLMDSYQIPCVNSHYVDAIYQTGIYEAVDDLYRHGHRKFAYLEGLKSEAENREHPRLKAFRKKARELQIPEENIMIIPANAKESTDELAGIEATKRLLESGKQFTAVMAVNDLMAIGCIRELKNHGIRVPEDVSVVGCDNIIQTEYYTPSISTIDVDSYEVGRKMMDALIRRIHGEEVIFSGVECHYLRRESVADARQ